MKKQIIQLALVASLFTACNPSAKQENQQAEEGSQTQEPAMATQTFAVTKIIDSYLELKDALVADNSEKASQAGSQLVDAFNQFDKTSVPSDKASEINDILENALEQAEHISANGGNIGHQREHLAVLSNDLNDLLDIIGTDRPLYQTFCPMYDNNKGAIWLSASSEIKNPFFGSEMLTCGKVQKEIVVK